MIRIINTFGVLIVRSWTLANTNDGAHTGSWRCTSPVVNAHTLMWEGALHALRELILFFYSSNYIINPIIYCSRGLDATANSAGFTFHFVQPTALCACVVLRASFRVFDQPIDSFNKSDGDYCGWSRARTQVWEIQWMNNLLIATLTIRCVCVCSVHGHISMQWCTIVPIGQHCNNKTKQGVEWTIIETTSFGILDMHLRFREIVRRRKAEGTALQQL